MERVHGVAYPLDGVGLRRRRRRRRRLQSRTQVVHLPGRRFVFERRVRAAFRATTALLVRGRGLVNVGSASAASTARHILTAINRGCT